MSQRARIFAVLESKGFVTNADFQEMRITHTGRNRLTDEYARIYFGNKRQSVHFVKGKDFLSNRWELRPIEQAPAFGSTVTKLCEGCGHVFQARARDVKNGLGRFCSPQCAGRHGIQKRLASRDNRQASRTPQLEMAV